MLEHLKQGGWGMYPVLVLGLIGLGTGLRYAMRGDVRLRGFLESLAHAVLWFAVSGTVTGFIATGEYINGEALSGTAALTVALQGGKEALNVFALGVTVLGLMHLLVAVGRRRADARAA